MPVCEESTVPATYAYDGLGRRVKTTEDSVTAFFVYGVGLDLPWPKIGTTKTRHIYANGTRIAKVLDSTTYYVQADALDSTWRVTDAAKATVFSTSYDPFGRPDNIHYWKGATDTLIEEKYTYDARDRMTQVKVSKVGTTTKYMQLDYVYNKASEIASSTDDMFTGSGGASNLKSVTYQYDGDGRLAKAVGPFGLSEASQTLQWTYDAVGNLLTSKVDGNTYMYTYGAPPAWNRLDSFALSTMGFAYNSAGSMTCKTEGGLGLDTRTTSCSS